MEGIEVMYLYPVRLCVTAAEPSRLLAGVVVLLSFGRAPLRSPWEFFAMQLDRESATALREVLAGPPPAFVPARLREFRREFVARLEVFLVSERGGRRERRWRRRTKVSAETVLYPRWFIEPAESKRAAGMLAGVARAFPGVTSALVIDQRRWVLLQLGREDALRIRDALIMEAPPGEAQELMARYVERLGEMIDFQFPQDGVRD